jgi:hypothetical protein
MIFFPTSVDPVKAILAAAGWLTTAAPTSPAPVTKLTTPGRQVRFREDLGELERGDGGGLGGLEHHGVSRGERGSELPREHEQREIPRESPARPRRAASSRAHPGNAYSSLSAQPA